MKTKLIKSLPAGNVVNRLTTLGKFVFALLIVIVVNGNAILIHRTISDKVIQTVTLTNEIVSVIYYPAVYSYPTDSVNLVVNTYIKYNGNKVLFSTFKLDETNRPDTLKCYHYRKAKEQLELLKLVESTKCK